MLLKDWWLNTFQIEQCMANQQSPSLPLVLPFPPAFSLFYTVLLCYPQWSGTWGPADIASHLSVITRWWPTCLIPALEAEAGGSGSLGPAWSWVPGQPKHTEKQSWKQHYNYICRYLSCSSKGCLELYFLDLFGYPPLPLGSVVGQPC